MWHEWIAANHHKLIRYCKRKWRNRWQEAYDAAVDTSVSAAKRYDSERGVSFDHWMWISIRKRLLRLSKRKYHLDLEIDIADSSNNEAAIELLSIVETQCTDLEKRMIHALYTLGLSVQEYADQEGVSVSTINKRLWLLRKKLRGKS